MSNDLYLPTHSALIQLFILNVVNGPTIRFCNYSQSNGSNVAFGGLTYSAYPIECRGFEGGLNKELPSPELVVSNIFSDISALIQQYDGCINSQLIRVMVLAKNLDGQPGAVTEIEKSEFFNITSYRENNITVTFQLRSPLDLGRMLLPRARLFSVV
jgi:lambda family phage minor tail protein L